MKKILLINPPVSIYLNKTAFVPLALLILGACLKEIKSPALDFSHELLDLDLMLKQGRFPDSADFYRQAGDLILEKAPDVVLFTVHGLNHIVVLKLSARIKRARPNCVIVAGGVGPTLQAREASANCNDIDVIIKGEGEPVMRHLIPAALGDRDFSDVPSAVFRKNGRIVENPRLRLKADEPIPPPDYSLVRVRDYIDHNRTHPYVDPGFVLIESGRGCPYHCSFCSPARMWESRVRYRPVPEIIAEMKFLAQKGGDFSFFTQDNLEEGFLATLSAALIAENSGIRWGCYSRLDRLPDEMADLLARAGCRLIFTGLETPNRNAQKSIRKVLDTDAAFKKLQCFNKAGIRMIGSFIAGFAEETDADLDNTMRFAVQCATGLDAPHLRDFITGIEPDRLPRKSANICALHTLCYMPGTDDYEKTKDDLHITPYSLHPDCHGSYLFGYDQFKSDWSRLGVNPYINHLVEEKVRYYCAVLRLFNFLNSRPFHLALLLETSSQGPLALAKTIVADLSEEFVLSARIDRFEQKSRDWVMGRLDFAPPWTVKKGQ